MNTNINRIIVGALVLVTTAVTAGESSPRLPAHDCVKIVWTTPSTNALGSMPLGNGDISLMVWVEADGDLLLYVGKCDSWDENGRLLKLGRLRLHFSQQPFAAGQPFRQTLQADRGEIEIAAGQAERELRVRLWVDAHQPVVRIETESDQEFELETRLEVWRTAERELPEEMRDQKNVFAAVKQMVNEIIDRHGEKIGGFWFDGNYQDDLGELVHARLPKGVVIHNNESGGVLATPTWTSARPNSSAVRPTRNTAGRRDC